VSLCDDLDEPAQVDLIAARIGAVVAAPIFLGGAEMNITASVGIAFSGPGNQLSEDVLRDADAAMYQAKRKGGARHQIVDLREQDLAVQRDTLEHDLRGAPTRGELRMESQPIVESGTDPERVTLEVTESVFVQDSERARIVLTELKRIGVRLALDDFGTGYSSFNYLRQFPIDVVKIDHGFVADLEHDRASHAIVVA